MGWQVAKARGKKDMKGCFSGMDDELKSQRIDFSGEALEKRSVFSFLTRSRVRHTMAARRAFGREEKIA
jgi:hypothetical protein